VAHEDIATHWLMLPEILAWSPSAVKKKEPVNIFMEMRKHTSLL